MARGADIGGGRGGFTLLELVLVMVVICTVLAMAAPSLRGFFASRQTQDTAAYLVALTELARSQAISEGRVYRLNLDPVEGTYWLTVQGGGDFERLETEFGRTFRLPDGVRMELSTDSGHITFQPTGRVDAAKNRLTARQGDRAFVNSTAATERFQVTDLHGSEVPR